VITYVALPSLRSALELERANSRNNQIRATLTPCAPAPPSAPFYGAFMRRNAEYAPALLVSAGLADLREANAAREL